MITLPKLALPDLESPPSKINRYSIGVKGKFAYNIIFRYWQTILKLLKDLISCLRLRCSFSTFCFSKFGYVVVGCLNSQGCFQNQRGDGIQNWYGERTEIGAWRQHAKRWNLEDVDFWSSEEFPEGAGKQLNISKEDMKVESRAVSLSPTNNSAWLSGAIEAARMFSKWQILHFSRIASTRR